MGGTKAVLDLTHSMRIFFQITSDIRKGKLKILEFRPQPGKRLFFLQFERKEVRKLSRCGFFQIPPFFEMVELPTTPFGLTRKLGPAEYEAIAFVYGPEQVVLPLPTAN